MPRIKETVIFETELFAFMEVEGVGAYNTPYKDIGVVSKGLAEKWTVRISFCGCGCPVFNGEPVEYTYDCSRIGYGVTGGYKTHEEIEEFITVLRSAQEFKGRIDEYMGFIN